MEEPQLRRSLGLTSALMITVGSVIGSGIFLKPLDIARALPDTTWIYGSWTVLGIVCLFGAFAYGELGAMLQDPGGQYSYLREGWGRFVAFLYGWCLLLIINTGTLAALAVVFASSLEELFGLSKAFEVPLAVSMILALAAVNHFGVGWGAALQNLTTIAKLLALGIIVGAGFLLAAGPDTAPVQEAASLDPPGLLAGLVAASVALFWAYEGWHQLAFNAAEIKKPHRNLPRGLGYGLGILIVTYVLVNAVYLHVVPQSEMVGLAKDIQVPRLAMSRIFGAGAADWLTALICLSVFGAANPNMLSTPRAFYAMARDGLILKGLMRIHPVYRTPTTAIWVQAIWASVLVVLLQTFKDITEYVIFAALIFYALTVGSLFILRVRDPERQRPYRCFGYPLAPALFVAVVLFVDAYTLVDPGSRENALKGLVILGAGAVVYALFLRNKKTSAAEDPAGHEEPGLDPPKD